MRKLIIVALAALVVGSTLALTPPSLAGAKKAGAGAGQHAGKRLAKLAGALNLTAAQKAQIRPIVADAARKVRSLRQNTTLSPEARKAQMKAIRKDSMARIAAILTPEQKAKLIAMRRHRAHGKNGKVGVAA